ncbi:Ig-like domain-containing protein [Saccharopolyspora flava]|uniref:Ig-like domain (Group 3) n=1 Tax=Saccharopolyspora flava TaxID=95161 RepID=A0A1I6RK62_9PSEU|nr:Ig-like domain-containing protein [Saccharopolyspora flava]SFS65119.1 Ig-like domain (group 3) [Saccharopolyspora flava]
MELNLSAAGIASINAAIGHSATTTDSTGDPRAHAESANLDANALGIPLAVASDEASSDNATPTDSYTTGFGTISVPGVLSTGAINGSGSTNWAGDAACVPDGTPIAQSRTDLANATLGLTLAGVGLELLSLGALQTSGQTTLDAGSVVSSSSGNLSSLSLLNKLVQVEVLSNPTLTATSDGTTGQITANDYSVAVTIAGQRTVLRAGQEIPIRLNIGVLSTDLTLSVGQLVNNSSGPTASGSMTFLRLAGSVNGPLGVNLANVNMGLLPLSATATAPPGGVECDRLDAPAITSPSNGDITSETPTITGTGVPGATVTVTEGGTTIGTATVGPDGTWSLTPEQPFPPGEHTIQATQALGDAQSDPSNSVTFTVPDTVPPDPPVIQSPAPGDLTGDSTPTVSGTAEPGSTVIVTDDQGNQVGTTTADVDGNWTVEVAQPFPDGPHTITATATDAAGNTSQPSDPVTFTVDTTPPGAPTITGPGNGSLTGDSTPTVSGTAEPGSTVTVTDDQGNELGTTTADADGNWVVEVGQPLLDGPHTITATATDTAGNTSQPSDPVTFTVDTTPPGAPAITGPADGSAVGDNTPTITGTGEPGATVEVTVDGTVIGTTTVNNDGTWTLDVPQALVDGPHTVTATQTDLVGNASPASSETTFTLDTAVEPPVISEPTNGSATGDSTPTISGTGEPGATVTVTTADGTQLGTATVGPDGTWSFDVQTPLPDGQHTITATQTDQAGNTSADSSSVIFAVDTTADPPVITSPADGSTTGDNTPTITGTGEPGSTVAVTVDGTSVGTATVGPDGTWHLDVPTAFPDGRHTVEATQTDPVGNTSAPASSTFAVDTTAPQPPVITGPSDGATTGDNTPTITGTAEPGSTVTVTDAFGNQLGTATADEQGNWSVPVETALADGSHTITATATDPVGNVSGPSAEVTFTVDTTMPEAPVIQSPADGATIGDATPTVSGTGEPGATVQVSIDGSPVGTAQVGEDGTWSLDPTTPLAEGRHVVTATQTDGAGNTSPVGSNAFTVDLTAPAPPVIASPTSGEVVSGPPTFSGTGEPGATVEVVVDGESIGTTIVGEDGTWSLVSQRDLGDGEHTATATQTDPAGNRSAPSPELVFTTDSTAPAPPSITGPADGTVTNDNTPTISGRAEPGSSVVITDSAGVVVGTTQVDANGNWSFTPEAPLDDGSYTFTATATDAAGNVSAESEPVTILVDTVAPPTPVITSPADGSTVETSRPVIEGEGEPGATVEVTVDGQLVGTAEVGEDGRWRLELTDPLGNGRHTVSVVQVDEAGNRSTPDSMTFEVNAPATDPPADQPPPDGGGDGDGGAGDGAPGGAPSGEADGDELAVTGTSLGTTLLSALAFLVLGGGLFLSTRRRHNRE